MPPVIGAVTVGYVAAPGPLLAPPVLAGDDGLDESALPFLVQQTLLAREKEEAEAVEAAVGGVGGESGQGQRSASWMRLTG